MERSGLTFEYFVCLLLSKLKPPNGTLPLCVTVSMPPQMWSDNQTWAAMAAHIGKAFCVLACGQGTVLLLTMHYRLQWYCTIVIVNYSKTAPPGNGALLSIRKLVCLFVCLSVCLSIRSLLMYRLNIFLPPLPKVRCPTFLEIRNPWGKVMKRSGLTFKTFYYQRV